MTIGEWLRRYRAAGVAVAVGTAVSLTAFGTVREWERDRAATDFANAASDRADVLRWDLESNVNQLNAVARFFQASTRVDAASFRSFVTDNVYFGQSDIRAVQWAPRVTAGTREAFEREARAAGYAGFAIRERDAQGRLVPAGRRAEYFPVRYAEPLAPNRARLGWDLGSDPAFREAIVRARNSGGVVVTTLTPLAGPQEEGGRRTFALVHPVYRRGAVSRTLEQRRRDLSGFLVQALWLDAHVERAIGGLRPAGVDIYIIDPAAPAGQRLAYFHRSRTSPVLAAPASERNIAQRTGLQWTAVQDVAGRPWMIVFRPAPTFLAAHRDWQSATVLSSGLLLTLLAASFLASLSQRTARVEQLVQVRTADLQREIEVRKQAEAEKAQLATIVEHAEDAVVGATLEGVITSWNAGAERLTGYRAEEAIGRAPTMFLPPDRQHEVAELLERVQRGERISQFETVALRRDGACYDVSLSLAPVRDGSGHLTGMSVIARDISERKQAQHAQAKLIRELGEALANVKSLSGLLPICANCKKVRDDTGYWNQIEEYLHKHSAAEFSHGLCPDCARKLYGDYLGTPPHREGAGC